MKVLMFGNSFFDRTHKEFSRNKTGYGLLLKEIITTVGARETVVVETFRITEGFELRTELGNCRVRRHSAWMILKNFRFRDIINTIRAFFRPYKDLKTFLYSVYCNLCGGVFRNAIREEKPDIVHIHGINPVFIDACRSEKVPYVVTQHGLNGLREDVGRFYFDIEKKFFSDAKRDGVPVTVISTGIKKRVEEHYLDGMDANNVYVVTNGTNLARKQSDHGQQREKHITVIGTLCSRKNQLQVVEAIRLLGDRLDGYTVYFCGGDDLNGLLQEKAEEYGIQDRVRFMGFVEPKTIDTLLEQAELNVLASKDEGFGISMIEGFVHGVPSVTFADLDAVPDIYNEKVMVLCHERSDRALAEAMEKALNTDWDREYIRNHSLKFSLERMAQNYSSVYKDILGQSEAKNAD